MFKCEKQPIKSELMYPYITYMTLAVWTFEWQFWTIHGKRLEVLIPKSYKMLIKNNDQYIYVKVNMLVYLSNHLLRVYIHHA
jgi:hypothetical protein